MMVKKEIEEKWANKEKLDQKDLKVFMTLCWLLLVYEYQYRITEWPGLEGNSRITNLQPPPPPPPPPPHYLRAAHRAVPTGGAAQPPQHRPHSAPQRPLQTAPPLPARRRAAPALIAPPGGRPQQQLTALLWEGGHMGGLWGLGAT